MIVAEKRQYYGTLNEEQYNQNTRPGRPVRQKNQYAKKRRALARVCAVSALAIMVISGFAAISECNYDIRAMEMELEELKKANERLQLQHAQAMDINWIEEHAINQLDMVYPDNKDIVYVAVQGRSDGTSLAAAEDENSQSVFAADGWFTVLAGKVNKVFDIK